MKQTNRQLDSFGIPSWIGEFCDQHQFCHRQVMRSYRLLMVIFAAIIEMSIPDEASDDTREMELLAFKTWFLKLGRLVHARVAIHQMHRQAKAKYKSTENIGHADRDKQLSYILEVYFSLFGSRENDPAAECYFEMVSEGWANGDQDDYRESLYSGLIAILLTYADYDLIPDEERPDRPERGIRIDQACEASVLKLSPSLAWRKVQAVE